MNLPLTPEEISALVRSSTDSVFQMMLGMNATPARAGARIHINDGHSEVASLICFTGQWNGSGTIRCSDRLACVVSGRMLMTEFEAVNEEVLDAMGEIANMVIGHFKEEAFEKLGTLSISTPTVIYGRDFHTRGGSQSGFTVPFDCEGETLEVRVCLVPAVR